MSDHDFDIPFSLQTRIIPEPNLSRDFSTALSSMASGDRSDSSTAQFLTCPVCLELPLNKVFQCREGHLICEECSRRLSECPQCRLPFEGVAIRSLLAEMLLDQLTFQRNCPYEQNGCKVKANNRKDLQAHVSVCPDRFGPSICLCKRLGFATCEFQMNGATTVREALQHFETVHQAAKQDSDSAELQFSNYPNILAGSKLIILDQQAKGYACLLQIRHMPKPPQRLVWIPFYLRYPTLGRPGRFISEPKRKFGLVYRYPSNSAPKAFYIDGSPELDILTFGGPTFTTEWVYPLMLREDLMKCLEESSQSLFVQVALSTEGGDMNFFGRGPLISITPSEMTTVSELPKLDKLHAAVHFRIIDEPPNFHEGEAPENVPENEPPSAQQN